MDQMGVEESLTATNLSQSRKGKFKAQVVDFINQLKNEDKMQDTSSSELLKKIKKHIIEAATLISQVEIRKQTRLVH